MPLNWDVKFTEKSVLVMRLIYKTICYALLLLLVLACSDEQQAEPMKTTTPPLTEKRVLDVFKSPTCGCCGKWISHIEDHGVGATIHHPDNLNLVKQKLGIAPVFQSCHTAVSKDGYVFEGHIPAAIMQRFLSEKPKGALGLAVPGMPAGSPGMEMADRRDSYDVLLLMKDGTASVYQHIAGNP
ncbi:MAG: DUF411 domain-containing protein [Cycloclasticus sp.]